MEAGLPLYGHELDRATSPLEAGLKSFVKFGHGFVGEEALAAQRDGTPRGGLSEFARRRQEYRAAGLQSFPQGAKSEWSPAEPSRRALIGRLAMAM